MQDRSGVKSVERAFMVLEQVSLAKDGIGITELATRMDMYKSTIHRVLGTLVSLGYVEQDAASGRYKLGYRLLEVSSRLLHNLDARQEALPFLHELAEQTGEVVHFVVRDKGEVVYIEKVEGSETIRMHSKIGSRVPVHCTGVGKAILSWLPREEVQGIIQRYGLAAHTPHTLTEEDALFADLALIRARGYALDLEENELGITCVAAPVMGYGNRVLAGISISGPTMRMQGERLQQMADLVRSAGERVSIRLGYVSSINHP